MGQGVSLKITGVRAHRALTSFKQMDTFSIAIRSSEETVLLEDGSLQGKSNLKLPTHKGLWSARQCSMFLLP